MRCTFLGTGSSFDAGLTNVSMLVEGGDKRILLDCGFNAAHACIGMVPDAQNIDALWISHFHGDHFFGVPFLLGAFFSAGRTKDLHVCGPVGVEEKIGQVVDLAYPNLRAKIDFKLVFHEFSPGDQHHVSGFNLKTCSIDHSASALALRLDCAGKMLFYTGDGQLTDDCRKLAEGVDLAILEAYGLDDSVKGHSCVRENLDFVISAGIRNAALVHIEPLVRICCIDEIEALLSPISSARVFLPEQGQCIEV
ncbi:MBL fold metallo-hydrolase [Maridesulfovibrio sp.]|uniref:MBL fold metallo-hydrolase n=1 Tax=Maridesulfovibrio sp. TaxID=2795000 RepID=UPI002AA7C12D|nr:MBL fold metallo-hydrolase [Maridesulfovibrio sp.]